MALQRSSGLSCSAICAYWWNDISKSSHWFGMNGDQTTPVTCSLAILTKCSIAKKQHGCVSLSGITQSEASLWVETPIEMKMNKGQDKFHLLQMQGVTFPYFSSDSVSEWGWQFVLIFLCRLAVSPPSHLKCLGYNQTGSAVVSVCQHRLTFLPHEVSICCTWQAAGSAQFARLVKSDTDKKRLGENWHTEEKSTATANIWWCDFRWIGDGSQCWHLCNICTVWSSETVSLPSFYLFPLLLQHSLTLPLSHAELMLSGKIFLKIPSTVFPVGAWSVVT